MEIQMFAASRGGPIETINKPKRFELRLRTRKKNKKATNRFGVRRNPRLRVDETGPYKCNVERAVLNAYSCANSDKKNGIYLDRQTKNRKYSATYRRFGRHNIRHFYRADHEPTSKTTLRTQHQTEQNNQQRNTTRTFAERSVELQRTTTLKPPTTIAIQPQIWR